MVASCSAYKCTNRFSKNRPDISFFRFPFSRPEIFIKWYSSMRRKNWFPSKTSCLCSEHFLPEDFRPRLPGQTGKVLKYDSVPSQFDFSPPTPEKVRKQRRKLKSKLVKKAKRRPHKSKEIIMNKRTKQSTKGAYEMQSKKIRIQTSETSPDILYLSVGTDNSASNKIEEANQHMSEEVVYYEDQLEISGGSDTETAPETEEEINDFSEWTDPSSDASHVTSNITNQNSEEIIEKNTSETEEKMFVPLSDSFCVISNVRNHNSEKSPEKNAPETEEEMTVLPSDSFCVISSVRNQNSEESLEKNAPETEEEVSVFASDSFCMNSNVRNQNSEKILETNAPETEEEMTVLPSNLFCVTSNVRNQNSEEILETNAPETEEEMTVLPSNSFCVTSNVRNQNSEEILEKNVSETEEEMTVPPSDSSCVINNVANQKSEEILQQKLADMTERYEKTLQKMLVYRQKWKLCLKQVTALETVIDNLRAINSITDDS